jgi:hypothetical protein
MSRPDLKFNLYGWMARERIDASSSAVSSIGLPFMLLALCDFATDSGIQPDDAIKLRPSLVLAIRIQNVVVTDGVGLRNGITDKFFSLTHGSDQIVTTCQKCRNRRRVSAAGTVRRNSLYEAGGQQPFALAVIKNINRLIHALQMAALHEGGATEFALNQSRGISDVLDIFDFPGG